MVQPMRSLTGIFGQLSIRSKLFVSYSLMMLLTISLGGFIMSSVIRAAIESNIESELSNSTNTILNLVKSTTNASIKNLLRAIAEKNWDIAYHFYNLNKSGIIDTNTAKQRAQEILLSQDIGTTGYIYCIDSKGVIKVHPNSALLEENISQNDFVKRQIEKKIGYLQYDWANPGEKSRRAKALYMVYFEPWDWIISVSSYREEFIELLNTNDFEESVKSLQFGKTGYSYVIDRKGNFLIHPTLQGTSIMDYKGVEDLQFISDMIAKKNGRIEYLWKNPEEQEARKKLVMFNYIPELDWIVASSRYLDEFYQPLKTINYTILIVILITLILIFVITFYLGRSITYPLYQLIDSFKLKAEGDFSHRMEDELGGEIGELSSYYNNFMRHLEDYHAKLLISEENYRGIFEGAVEGIFKISVAGKIISLNSSMALMLGYQSPDELSFAIDRLFFNLFVGENTGYELINILNEQKSVSNYQTRLHKKNGKQFWVSLSIRGIFEANTLTFIEGFVSDISSQKAFEQELIEHQKEIEEKNTILERQTTELKRLGEIKDDFLAMTTHELRTPLHGIIGIAESLLDGASKELTPQIKNELNMIISSGRRLSNLVNDLLVSSKLKQKDIQLHRQPLDLKKNIDVVLYIYQTLLKNPSLKLENLVADNIFVMADEERLQQILHNLIGNAIKFSDSGLVSITAKTEEGKIHISVKDTGIGIDADKLEDIFLPFEQVDYSSTRRYPGTGLGLSITKQLVELHGGKIQVRSHKDEGSVFTFTLDQSMIPAKSSSLPFAKSIEILPKDNGLSIQKPSFSLDETPDIVVVDDDIVNLHIVSGQLRQARYRTAEFTSGKEAIEFVLANKPRLLLLDIMMPNIDGFQVSNLIRNTYPLHELPIIFLTARNQVTDKVHGFKAGANDYLTKPFSKYELLARVQTQLRLLEATDHLVSLRRFANRIDAYMNINQLFKQAFQYLVEYGHLQNVVLMSDGRIVASDCADENFEQTARDVMHSDEEISVISYQNTQLVSIQLKGLDSQRIVLQTKDLLPELGLEYIRNLIEQIKTTRKNINKLTFDPNISKEIFTIGSLMPNVVYVQSAKQYCIVHTERETVELRLSLKEIVLRFQEYQLLQVHRSYLINPTRVTSIKLGKSKKLDISLGDVMIPVGLNYISTVSNIFPNLIPAN